LSNALPCPSGAGWPRLGRRIALVVLAGFLLQGCLVTGLESVSPEPSLASSFVRPDDPQEELGQREHPLVLAKYGGEYINEKAEEALALIVGKLVSVSDDPSRIYKVTILDTPKVNAFALPGGYLYITRGLLALANDSSEIAAVIAHEMSHVAANHAILRQEKLSSVKVGEEVVNDVLGDSVAARVALAANQIKLADFSREQELQADAIGIRMIGRAGFDPYAAARFLETMQAYQSFMAGNSDPLDDVTFLSTHPTTPQRVELARRHARFFGAPGIGERQRDRYLAGIDGLLFGDTAEEGFVRGRVFSHTGLGITFTAPEGSRVENQPKAVIVTGPGEAATRFDAAAINKRDALTDYLKSGWINGLVEESIVEGKTPTGLEMAAADAQADGWRFRVKVIRIGQQVYRFITALPNGSPQIMEISDQITSTFRELYRSERKALAPLKVRVVEVGRDDSLGELAGKMRNGEDSLTLFKLINGLQPGETPLAGTKVKIVTDS
jgi:predicted Zn-dependent protease